MQYQSVELDGVRYAIVRERELHELARKAGVELLTAGRSARGAAGGMALELDRETLARRLVQRRRRTGLTQVDLARRAGIRVETLNRIERGRTTPDFSTVRKLVMAMNAAEAQAGGSAPAQDSAKETDYGSGTQS